MDIVPWSDVAVFMALFAVLAGWVVVLVVIPGVIALYGSRLLPLTGQWRKRLAQWWERTRKTRH